MLRDHGYGASASRGVPVKRYTKGTWTSGTWTNNTWKARALAGTKLYSSSRVWTFVVGAELAVQSQQRRTTVHDTHSCSQHCLELEPVGLALVVLISGDKLFRTLSGFVVWSCPLDGSSFTSMPIRNTAFPALASRSAWIPVVSIPSLPDQYPTKLTRNLAN